MDIVDQDDLHTMAGAWLQKEGEGSYNVAADLRLDSKINNVDSDILAANWQKTEGCRPARHYYYHYDGLGSVVAVTDSAGNTVETYAYDVYGRVQIKNADGVVLQASRIHNPYFFTGRRFDTETGLYYYRARYYSPKIGRFLQTDPIGYEGGINLYAYCGNNPINAVDPSGTNVFGGLVSLAAGNGFNTSYDMGWSQAGQLGMALAEGAGQGAAAWADGVIPFADPFDNYYDPGDSMLKFSRAMGHVSRDALLAAAIPNIGSWAKNPVMYEVGSTALSNAKYAKYGLNGLSAIQKGVRLTSEMRGAANVLRSANYLKATQLFLQGKGLTPGANLAAIGGLEFFDYFVHSEKKK